MSLVCRHIPGVQNGAADALSRNALPQLVPGASEVPTALPDVLLEWGPQIGPVWTGSPCSVVLCEGLGRQHP